MQDEQNVESPFKHRVHFVFWLSHLEQHAEEVSRIAEVVIRIHVGLTKVMPKRNAAIVGTLPISL